MKRSATFAIPGDIETPTGGYIYEKQLLLGLRRIGWNIEHLQLPGGFPEPAQKDMAAAVEALASLAPDRCVILDGFLPGCIPPGDLRRMRAPYITVTHHPLCYETGIDPTRARVLRETERENLAGAAHIIVPSPHTADMLIGDFGLPADEITVALPGVLRPTTPRAVSSCRLEILSVGQLVPRKGHNTLLQALASMQDLDWSATIVGRETDQTYGRALRLLSDDLGITSRVRFAGEVAPDALSGYYTHADVFALATQYEGYGMVFAEAMTHGLPIVTCDGGAVPDTVPRDAGIIVPVQDTEAFAAALRHLLEDAGARHQMATASARRGLALPDWDATARIVAQVMQQVAG